MVKTEYYCDFCKRKISEGEKNSGRSVSVVVAVSSAGALSRDGVVKFEKVREEYLVCWDCLLALGFREADTSKKPKVCTVEDLIGEIVKVRVAELTVHPTRPSER